MENLVDLYKWFEQNRGAIIKNHLHECVLLKDNAVIGYYPNTEAALAAAHENGFKMGEYIIQDCTAIESIEDKFMI